MAARHRPSGPLRPKQQIRASSKGNAVNITMAARFSDQVALEWLREAYFRAIGQRPSPAVLLRFGLRLVHEHLLHAMQEDDGSAETRRIKVRLAGVAKPDCGITAADRQAIASSLADALNAEELPELGEVLSAHKPGAHAAIKKLIAKYGT